MAPLRPALDLLAVTWTDPLALGAIAVGIVLVGFVVLTLRKEGASSSEGADLQEMKEQAQARDREREEAAEEPAPSTSSLAAGEGRTVGEMLASEEIDDAALLSRFVLDGNGETLGETLTVTDDKVVLKRDGAFYAVDHDVIIEKQGTLVADANIDWDEAEEAGETWREDNLDKMEYDDSGMPKANS